MPNFDETISGTFALTVAGQLHTGTTDTLPEEYFDGFFGRQFDLDVLDAICDEQGFGFTSQDVQDWEIVPVQ